MPRHLPDLFRARAELLGPRTAVREKRHGVWVDSSWNDWAERVESAARGWLTLGLGVGERVAIWAENRVDWLTADLSVLTAGGVSVPLHAPYAPAAIVPMLNDCQATAVVVSGADRAAKIRDIAGDVPTLRNIVVIDESAEPSSAGPWTSSSLAIGSLESLEQRGRRASVDAYREFDDRLSRLSREHLASIFYTSGTTGEPKGAMLTHGNFLSNALALNEALGPFPPGAVFFNWLPLSHAYARTVDAHLALAAGGTLALAQSPEAAVEDAREARPYHISSVPRFYEKILASIAPASADERRRRLRGIFGPRIGWLGCGGAALPIEVAEVYRDAGLEIVVGYGLTEASPVIATNRLGANRLGTVGRALPGVEIRIADDGEILTRGPNVMAGYWNSASATADVVQGGWLRTGDLGFLDADGFLTVAGRKKDLIVLSTGKKIAPAPLEAKLSAIGAIEGVVVFGEGRPFLTAVVFVRDGHPRDARPLLEAISTELADRPPWEQVRKIVVAPEAPSRERGEVTVSLKIRRAAVYENYRERIDRLYE